MYFDVGDHVHLKNTKLFGVVSKVVSGNVVIVNFNELDPKAIKSTYGCKKEWLEKVNEKYKQLNLF